MRIAVAALALVACGGGKIAAGVAASTAPSAPPAPAHVDAIAPVAPSVELRDGASAIVGGANVPFDGVAEGLAWPALQKAVGAKPGGTIAIAVGRDVPVDAVMRAVWTLRDADVRLQTADAAGAVHVIDLRPKPAAPAEGCHLAVFVGDDGTLRVAAPGGPRSIAGPQPAETLARALADERARCPLRYVAFGAEKGAAPWSRVFDVAWVATRDGATGDARVVLGTPVHFTGK